MTYRWKPSKTAKREFAQKMQNDTDFAQQYEQRKVDKATKRRNTSNFDYNTAGGNYVPTKEQNDFCHANESKAVTIEQKEAFTMVMYGYSCNEKVHHDYIHIVNEMRRNNNQ